MTGRDPIAEKRRRVIEDYQRRISALRAKQVALAQKILANANNS